MQQHNFTQGSEAWHAHRANSKNASDAPAMLGCSPYTTRQQLLHALHTGLRPEASADQERIYAAGHAIEAAQRPGAEKFIGEELFPVVGSQEVDGVLLSASFDGITMTEEEAYECKSLNDNLRAAFADMETIAPADRERSSGKCLPKHYRVQMEQQLAVSGARRVLFVAATKDGADVRRCWYYPDAKLRAEIIAGWKQLEADLASYAPPSASAVEKIVAEPVQALPAVSVVVEGSIVIRENFDAFEVAMRHFLEHRLIREPKTDQDFADLDVQIKAMKGAEAALESAEAGWIAQIEAVSTAKRRKDMLRTLVRDNRLLAEKLLASEKERRKGDIVAAGVKALADHVAALNKRLGKPYMPQVPADFGGAIRGMKSLTSMENAVATELARCKIAANEIADRIDANLKALRDPASEHAFLFADTASLVLKAPDDCAAVITSRIGEHRAAEERRAAELAERERARIRAEEQVKLRREQEAREAEERRAHQATLTHTNGAPMFGQQVKENGDRLMLDDQGRRSVFCDVDEGEPAPRVAPAAAGPAVIQMPTRAPAGPPTLQLGAIGKRLGFTVTAEFLAELGFPVVKTDRGAKLYREESFPLICDAILAHVAKVRDQQLQAA